MVKILAWCEGNTEVPRWIRSPLVYFPSWHLWLNVSKFDTLCIPCRGFMPTAGITILGHDEVDGNGFHPHFPSGTFLIGLNVKVRLGVSYE